MSTPTRTPIVLALGLCGLLALGFLWSSRRTREPLALEPGAEGLPPPARLEPPHGTQQPLPGRAEVPEPELRAAPTDSSTAPGTPPTTAIEQAQEELAQQIDASLDGILDIDRLLDQVLAFADLPIDEKVDFEYEDNDSIAYRVLGTPSGTEAHLLVGRETFPAHGPAPDPEGGADGGTECRALQLEIQLGADQPPGFHRDALREGPRLHLGLFMDPDGRPVRMGLVTERAVALGASRRAGLDAYEGRFTSGASYGIELDGDDLRPRTAETIGLVDGHYASGASFQGQPLRGDLTPERERVEALARRLQAHFERVRATVK